MRYKPCPDLQITVWSRSGHGLVTVWSRSGHGLVTVGRGPVAARSRRSRFLPSQRPRGRDSARRRWPPAAVGDDDDEEEEEGEGEGGAGQVEGDVEDKWVQVA
jgi:hypothetical protein